MKNIKLYTFFGIFTWRKNINIKQQFLPTDIIEKSSYVFNQGCRSRPKPPLLAGAGAVFLVRLLLLLLFYCKYFIFTGP